MQIFTADSFLRLYVSGSILEDHVVVQPLQTHAPQLRQWHARRKTANLPLQMKQFGDSSKGTIFGGAFAIAASLASRSEENEKAFKYFEAVFGFVATPF
jgi:hypothetical protein